MKKFGYCHYCQYLAPDGLCEISKKSSEETIALCKKTGWRLELQVHGARSYPDGTSFAAYLDRQSRTSYRD